MTDLELVSACAAGDPAALATFETLLGEQAPALRKLGLSASDIDEVLQRVRADLLVGTPVKILGFAGKSSLAAWLRTVAVRAGMHLARGTRAHDPLDDDRDAALAADPELAYMKRHYGDAFHRAFAHALAVLPAADRLLLKQRFRHGMGVVELGRHYAVNAGTITRRVQAARSALADGTRAAMMRDLGVGATEVASILRMIESQLEVTLSTRS